MNAIFVAVEGPTGAGKTALATRLALVLGAQAMFDPFEANPFLSQLLSGEQGDTELALRAELTFFALRIAQLHHIAGLLAAGRGVVSDWALLKQPIFAATTLDPGNAARVAATVGIWAASLPAPDLVIGLSAPASTLRGRICRRGRDMEASVTAAQLAALSAAFENAYAQWPGPLIRVSTTTFDTFDERHLSELATRVRQLPIPEELR
jgi:deoxyadenosine/deoxycytidine kinase